MIISVSRRNLVPPTATDELLADETPGAGGWRGLNHEGIRHPHPNYEHEAQASESTARTEIEFDTRFRKPDTLAGASCL